ncbi:MAG: hypothetical protein ACI4A8_06445, partial [Muribaculaceae bacterium]
MNWHYLDDAALETLKRQAEREGGQLLILPSKSEEAGALSSRTVDLSSESKDTTPKGEKQATDIKNLRKKWAYMRGKMPDNSVFVIEDTDGRLYSFDDDATRINAALNGKGEKAKTDFIEITEQQFKDAAYVLGLKDFRVGLYNVNDINIDHTADTVAKSALDTVKDIIRAVAERRDVDTGNFGELLRGLTDDELNSASRYADNAKGRSKADKENIGALRRAIATKLDERDNAADTKAAERSKMYDETHPDESVNETATEAPNNDGNTA